jgi:hypothetical protein
MSCRDAVRFVREVTDETHLLEIVPGIGDDLATTTSKGVSE